MIEALVLVFASTFGVVAVGLLVLWVKSTLIGETADVVEPVGGRDGTSRRVASAKARWRELRDDAIRVGADLSGEEIGRLDRAEENAEARSTEMEAAWSQLGDVTGGPDFLHNDMSRHLMNERKAAALTAVERFEESLNELEFVIDSVRR